MIIRYQCALEGGFSLIHDKKIFFLAAYARISYNLLVHVATIAS